MRADYWEIDDESFDSSTLNVEARKLEKLVVERCMVGRTMRLRWAFLEGMERYHEVADYAAAQH